MKIIQVVGRSNAGKTTFIKNLIGALSAHGAVGAVKHLGHHGFSLEPGKDTTMYYESYAAISGGVDEEKSVVVRRENDLNSTLEVLCNAGIEYAILEGFKSRSFPRIVIGDLESENVVLRNPSVEEVIAALDRFEDYYTVEGLVRDLRRECDISHAGAILTFNGIVREWSGDDRTEYMDFDKTVDTVAESIQKEMETVPGIIGARFYHRKGRLYAGEDITYLAILAEHRQEAFAAAANAIDRLKRELHDVEK
ncbi:Molybdopterin synthase catalytic subunit [Methanoculleus chikugoensis]|jgi:molybdopterin synthase catalytic subunit|uniref:Molybdopterin synthase catalytic subunit n=1 Tax=Methanoculleus chikugoensis TaxID=118126 RepID=A0A1M4MJB6_9EURY|nr:molybdopterin-guanine dinucleotide biosynthesis protein B [Methanoculleus chikugoensis]MDD4566345.1 molybdopterin-guanine dinucleotide biosynthesis protein B [Methanoculleus chikugoensis]NMA10623.1 molybdopterin-guanine dinucleotide biosynthesis protein B [Methanomicrobiales archaeon]SCL75021.1 Molybdopterin synthase catalytic subunit [Methanoculleus chikugoensis]